MRKISVGTLITLRSSVKSVSDRALIQSYCALMPPIMAWRHRDAAGRKPTSLRAPHAGSLSGDEPVRTNAIARFRIVKEIVAEPVIADALDAAVKAAT